MRFFTLDFEDPRWYERKLREELKRDEVWKEYHRRVHHPVPEEVESLPNTCGRRFHVLLAPVTKAMRKIASSFKAFLFPTVLKILLKMIHTFA